MIKKICLFGSGYCLSMILISLGAMIKNAPFVPLSHEESYFWFILGLSGFIVNLLVGLSKN